MKIKGAVLKATLRERKRAQKRLNLPVFLMLVSIGLLVAATAFLLFTPKPIQTGFEGKVPLDSFIGEVVNKDLFTSTTGRVLADTDCTLIDGGLTRCIAIIDGSSGERLHFKYAHNMSVQPCLAPDQMVKIERLQDGKVKVTRYQDAKT